MQVEAVAKVERDFIDAQRETQAVAKCNLIATVTATVTATATITLALANVIERL